MINVDVHQHLWTDSFVAALRARTEPPFLDGWTLHTAGEPPYEVSPPTTTQPVGRSRRSRTASAGR